MTLAYHEPVLSGEVISLLDPRPGQTYVDATAGGGGHSALIAQRIAPDGTLAAIDQDPEALAAAGMKLHHLSQTIVLIHGNFRNLAALLDEAGIGTVDGALFDLGVSSRQLDAAERGFSFRADAPLDMRMNPGEGIPASELLARLDRNEIARILKDLAEERWADRIAQFIVMQREKQPIRTTRDLVEAVQAAIPRAAWPKDIHPATRTFMAIRMAVNDELAAIEEGITAAIDRLKVGGRIVVISFHSLEDRIVKRLFSRYSGRCECPPRLPECRCGARKTLRLMTKKPMTATDEEVGRNPRSRSAKLRAAERIAL